MAWWAQQEQNDENRTIRYSNEWMGDDQERFLAVTESIKRELAEKYFTPEPGPRPWFPPSPHDTVNGVGVSGGFKFPIPDRPYRFRLNEKVNYLADILPVVCGKAITKRVVDAIEEIEPGVHQYLPCEVYFKDDKLAPEPRWLLNICSRLDTVAVEHSNVVVSPATGMYLPGNGPFDVKVWKDKVAGRAIWTEWKLGSYLYVGDALVDRLQSMDARGWRFDKYLPEV